MRHFITASHGPLSKAILESAVLIAGADLFENWCSIGVKMEDSSEAIRAAVDVILSGYAPEDEVIALTDVMSGNVNNILTEYAVSAGVRVVAGMNLAMVLEAGFSDEQEPIDDLCRYLTQIGKSGVRFVNDAIQAQSQEDEI